MMTEDQAYEKDEKEPRAKGLLTWHEIREKQEHELLSGLASIIMCRDMTGKQRLKALEGLAMIYINMPDDDGAKLVVDQFACCICHECGEICIEQVNEEYDERYKLCSGGSTLCFKDESKGMGNSEEEFRNNLTYSKPNNCKNIGRESMGITLIVEKMKNA